MSNPSQSLNDLRLWVSAAFRRDLGGRRDRAHPHGPLKPFLVRLRGNIPRQFGELANRIQKGMPDRIDIHDPGEGHGTEQALRKCSTLQGGSTKVTRKHPGAGQTFSDARLDQMEVSKTANVMRERR